MAGAKIDENIYILVTVHDKELTVSCGSGTQKVKWLGNVAIARYDDETFQGWKILGVPVHMEKIETGEPLQMGACIKDCLKGGDRIKVETSMEPR